MKARDLMGMQVGTLTVIGFDEERHKKDLADYKAKIKNRVKRYWLCECSKCGQIRSVETSNLLSGNTKGCVCDKDERTGIHNKKYNTYEYDDIEKCYKIYASNTGNIFLIDECDYEKVKEHCWYESDYGYLITRLDKDTQILLHRYIMLGEDSAYDNMTLVDHRSRDKHDNRRSNLRFASPVENARNMSIYSNNTSGHIGVSRCSRGNKWRAFITIDRKYVSLGQFDDINDAIIARKEAEIKYYGEFAPV